MNNDQQSNNKKTVVYISGPMTGYENNNYPAFMNAEKILKDQTIEIKNPARIDDGGLKRSYRFYMLESIKLLIECTEVVFLEGWEKSRGARIEYDIAKALDLPMSMLQIYPNGLYNIKPLQTTIGIENDESKTICEIADVLVSVDRRSQYGHPKDNFSDIGKMWAVQLGLDTPIDAHTVGLMMISVKLCREKFKHKKDNLVDIAGFAKTVDLCHTKI